MTTYKSEMIEFRAGRIILTEAEWTANTNVYPEGIIAITSDGSNAGRTKVFDGVKYWSQLLYNSGGGSGAVTSDDVTNDSAVVVTANVTEAIDALAGNFAANSAAIDAVSDLVDAGLPAGVYEAALTQVGTEAPTAVVFTNTTGRTVTWTREGHGAYTGTFSEVCVVANSGASIGSGSSADAVISPSITQLLLLPGSASLQTLTLAADGATEVNMTQTDDILASTLIRLILRT